MSENLARAQMLLAQSRAADAERETMLALANDPQNPFAHALLALTRVEQKRGSDALPEAQAAIGLAPDVSYFHYVHAFVLHHMDREKDALAAIDEAIRLSPEDDDAFALRASIQLSLRNWNAALADAEAALALNPEHVQSANLRAMALVRLGRKSEAADSVNYALERAPENAFSHANQGWTCLHRNNPRKAQDHFREALRLNPELEFARQGMLEALKARNPVYRAMLAYYLWMSRQSGRAQGAFIFGSLVVVQLVRGAAEAIGGWLFWPLTILFFLFIYLTWTARPMFNLLLRLDRFGRLVLSRDERVATNWFGATLAVVVGCVVWWMAGGGEIAMVSTLVAGAISICPAATFSHTGKNRRILAAYSAALVLLGGLGLAFAFTSESADVLLLFGFGFLGFQFLTNALNR